MMINTKWIFLVWSIAFILPQEVEAQVKKRIKYYELDVNRNLFFQPNTMAPYTGTAFDEYPNGKKKLEIPIKDGQIHGTVIEWEKNGQKIYQSKYEAGKQIGKEEQWYSTGNQSMLLNYVDGLAEGICIEWHKNETKKSEGLFRKDKEEGMHQWWFADGSKDQVIHFQNGLIEGKMQNWHLNGKLKLESNYKTGKLEGLSTEWHNNGEKKWMANYTNDEKDGESKTWGKRGQLLGKQVYKNGKLIEDYNYRSGNIKLIDGYIQVFNKPKSFYSLAIRGNKVNEADDKNNIIYSVEGIFLRIYDIPLDSVSTEKISEEMVLKKYVTQEELLIEEQLGTDIEIITKLGKNKTGQIFLHWHFVSPSSKDADQKARTVQKEHYISMLCQSQILNLHSIVTNSDNENKVIAMLQGIADSLEIKEEHIDLNALARQVK